MTDETRGELEAVVEGLAFPCGFLTGPHVNLNAVLPVAREIDAELRALREALETSAIAYHMLVHGKEDFFQCGNAPCPHDRALLSRSSSARERNNVKGT